MANELLSYRRVFSKVLPRMDTQQMVNLQAVCRSLAAYDDRMFDSSLARSVGVRQIEVLRIGIFELHGTRLHTVKKTMIVQQIMG